MKTLKGRQSAEQRGFQARCLRLNHPYAVAHTFEGGREGPAPVGGLEMTNFFEAVADLQMVAATKAKHRAAEAREAMRQVKVVQSDADAPMKLTDREQDQADQSRLMRLYGAWKRAEVKEYLEERHSEWRELKARACAR